MPSPSRRWASASRSRSSLARPRFCRGRCLLLDLDPLLRDNAGYRPRRRRPDQRSTGEESRTRGQRLFDRRRARLRCAPSNTLSSSSTTTTRYSPPPRSPVPRTPPQYQEQGVIDMATARQAATVVALQTAGYHVSAIPDGVVDYQPAPGSPGARALQVGDVITSIDAIADAFVRGASGRCRRPRSWHESHGHLPLRRNPEAPPCRHAQLG